MIKGQDKAELVGKIYYGEVVDNNDPLKEGRCRVKVYGVFDNIDDAHLPWAIPGSSKTFGGGDDHGFGDISIPKNKTVVRVTFSEGDLYNPEWHSIAYINKQLKDDISDTYLNSHVLLYDVDEKMKIFYTPGKGLNFFLKDSQIIINPDSSITIEHKNTDSIIELIGTTINITSNSTINITSNSVIKAESSEVAMKGSSVTKLGPAPTYSAVLAEPLWTFLKSLAAAVDGKMPPTPGVYSGQAAAAEQLSTSTNVKVSS